MTPTGAYQATPTSQSDPRWGGPCWKCGHPASYHGMTFCNAPANREKCDCDGYTPVNPQVSEGAREDAVREVVALLRSAPHRPWSEDDADSAESRSARAYNYALVVAANTVEGLLANADLGARS